VRWIKVGSSSLNTSPAFSRARQIAAALEWRHGKTDRVRALTAAVVSNPALSRFALFLFTSYFFFVHESGEPSIDVTARMTLVM
jgi:hypothetical protein